jgi:cytochrome-b5 reductase
LCERTHHHNKKEMNERYQAMNIEAVIFTIVCVLFGVGIATFFFQKNGKETIVEPKGEGTEEKSRGLQKEEKGTSSTHLSSLDDDKVLSPSQFRSFKLLKITKVSPNTKLYRFEIHPDKSLGLTIGRHISVRAEIDGLKVIRSYTPTSRIDQKGYFELLIKSYEFGKMSSFFHNLKIGQSVEVRGPVGRFHYNVNKYPKIGLVCGGTGITPCLQFLRSIFCCPHLAEDNTKLILFYQNRTEDDILLSEDLKELQNKFPHRLEIHFFLSNPSTPSSPYGSQSPFEKKGYINQEIIHSYMHVDHCPFVCLCGPSGFNDSMKKLLTNAGHEPDQSIYVW